MKPTKKPSENEQSDTERLRDILPELNPNQLRYLSIRHYCSSDKEAAKRLGISEQTIYKWDRIVKEALVLMIREAVLLAHETLKASLPNAAFVKVEGLQSEDERLRQSVATEILDRGLGKATQRTEIYEPDNSPIVITWGD